MFQGSGAGIGLLCLLATALGWGINWPIMKVLLQEWPPLSVRGWAGLAAALGLALIALLRGETLAVRRPVRVPLLVAAATNVTAWMGLSTLSMLWLDVAEGALLVYTMPIWVTLLAWPVLGERLTARGVAAIVLGLGGILVLLGKQDFALGVGKLPGVASALGAAILFAFGTVRTRSPLDLPPLSAVAWQVGLGCLPLVLGGLVLEQPRLGALSPTGWACMAYMTLVPMGLCYLFWFAALRRLPPAAASMATLITPVIGVVAAALALGSPVGGREVLALALTLCGVALALRRS